MGSKINMTKFNREFGIFLKERRKEMGFTKAKLAKLMGLTWAHMNTYENGKVKDIPIGMAEKLGKLLKFNLILDGDKKKIRIEKL